MSPGKAFLLRWLITTGAVFAAAKIVPGIHWDDASSLLVATLALGFLNALIKPMLGLLSIPALLAGLVTAALTAMVRPALLLLAIPLMFCFGVSFLLVVNAALLLLVSKLVHSFHVDSFSAAFWGGLIISIVSAVLNFVTGAGKVNVNAQVNVNPGQKPAPDRGRVTNDGGGPIIDV